MVLKGSAYRVIATMLVVGCLIIPLSAWGQESLPAKSAPAVGSLQVLPKEFDKGMARLREDIKKWESRLATATDNLTQTQKELDDLQVAVASLKTSMVLEKLPLLQVQEFLSTYADREKEIKAKLKDLGQEIEALKKEQEAQVVSQNTLRMQLSIIRAKKPKAVTLRLQKFYLNYLNLAGTRERLATRVLNQLERRRQLLAEENNLLADLSPRLKNVEEAWMAELLKRPVQAVPFWEQVARVWEGLAAVPERGWGWLNDLVTSGRLSAFIWRHVAPIIGLLGFIMLLRRSTRRFNELMTRRLRTWREKGEDSHLLPLYVLGQAIVANLFGLGLILWLGLFCWTFNLLNLAPVQLGFHILGTVWVLRLSLQWVQGFFAGEKAGGVLALEQSTARFYRRSLKFFAAYLCLGIFGLRSAPLLDFPETSRVFLAHFFLLGIIAWGWWLLRRPYLTRLLPELPDPAWLRRPTVSAILQGLLGFLLAVIILADLLGFQNLSQYLARAAAWTLLAAVLMWLVWLVGVVILRHLLHPEAGWVCSRFPDRPELICRVYLFSRWALSILLGLGVILWSLNSWGVKPGEMTWAFQWITWGPALGPVKLTVLNIFGAGLALYLGFFLSRLVRKIMLVRIFPRTTLDHGVQYTISTTLHYVILILAGLVALTILGFPLTNLALVAGALGVGIGFGLQNIVNNFLSGLILLFERPIRVGDMLVIDGQWGKVKEIRVRSTIFETFDGYVLIIPNSELVSNKVLNWTRYGAGINRITLKVGVSYDSDVRQVTQIITEVCRANPRVVAEPPPQVFFEAYGDSSLNFNIWAHVRTPGDRNPATHEINSAIFEAFQAQGIEIPFPQRDLHIKEWPEALEKKGPE